MTNRLGQETSPYLLQHQNNPVDWFPWGPEALALAREQDRPILVSIGYSACHWCHVMAHESFENPSIANFMNKHFINIKVDREERPDIDSIYMTAVQAMTGQGGWPLNAFLTPDGTPFFAGTYWPPADRMGMPGFLKVLRSVNDAWTTNRDGVIDNAEQIRTYLQNPRDIASEGSEADELTGTIAGDALAAVISQFDPVYGGFGNAPKFPQASVLEFLLRHWRRTGSSEALDIALTTLDHMAAGGINDQIGGGFARYSVDRTWLVPHFEKMLYDNAQLMSLYLDAWRITNAPSYRQVVERIATWTLTQMTSPEGGFYASLDADSEGVEGKFYVWTEPEVENALRPTFSAEEIDLVKLHFGVTPQGNFEGSMILSIVRPVEELAEHSGKPAAEITDIVQRATKRLAQIRAARIAPARDEKAIVSWNGLMLKALSESGAALQNPDLIAAARRNAGFLLTHLRNGNGKLARTWRNGTLRGNGTLEDYAFIADGLVALYRVTSEIQWLDAAGELLDIMVESFQHPSGAGFYDTADDHEKLVIRPRDLQDGATPSGNAVACDLLLTFGMLRGDDKLLSFAERTLASLSRQMREHPIFMGRYLAVLERWLGPRSELIFAGDPDSESLRELRAVVSKRYEPLLVVGFAIDTDERIAKRYPMLADRPIQGDASAYLCEHFTCLPPVTSPAALANLLANQTIAT